MDWEDRLDGLQFNDYTVVHKEIDPVAVIDREIVVTDRDWNLISDLQTLTGQLMPETELIRTLKKPWADSG